jgi:tetratricopeptide (TPR) repeat protein
VTRLLLLLLLALSLTAAQSPEETRAFEEMAANIRDGYYHVAAQVSGRNLITRFPENPESFFLYAYALYMIGDTANARQQLDIAMSLSERVTAQYDHLNGLLRASEGDVNGALRILQNAFIRSQDYTIAMDWGRIAWQAGNSQEALNAFRAASQTEVGRRELWPHLNSGRILKSLGRFEEAIEAFRAAIDTFDAHDTQPLGAGGIPQLPSPGYVEAYYRLGEIYEILGDISLARINYQAARNSDPNYEPAVNALDRLARTAP